MPRDEVTYQSGNFGIDHSDNRDPDDNNRQNALSNCTCPNCGFRIPQEERIPCINKVCPKCGIMMSVGK